MITLAANDVVDLRFTCGASGRTLTVYQSRLELKRV